MRPDADADRPVTALGAKVAVTAPAAGVAYTLLKGLAIVAPGVLQMEIAGSEAHCWAPSPAARVFNAAANRVRAVLRRPLTTDNNRNDQVVAAVQPANIVRVRLHHHENAKGQKVQLIS